MEKNICKKVLLASGSIKPLIIPYEYTKGTGVTNPSILKVDGKLLVVIRHVGYVLYHSENKQKFQSPYGSLVYLNPENDVSLRTVNYIGELDPVSLDLKDVKKIDTSKLDQTPLWEFIGLEDARLVNWENKLQLTGVRRDTTTNGQGRMELSEIVDYKEISRKRIEPEINTYCEKNWMPILDMPNHYVKWTLPTEIVKVDTEKETAKTIKVVEQDLNLPRDLRGGSQVVKYKNFWVCITHEVDLWYDEQGNKDCQYYHRFIVWNEDWKIVNYSDEFKFTDARIEFSCGLHIEDDNFIIPFGFQDTTSYVMKMPSIVFEKMVGLSNSKTEKKEFFKTDSLLDQFILNSEKPINNYNLGLYYFQLKQYASALSYFLRCAEFEEKNENLIYESLLFVAKCIGEIGSRETTEIALYSNAIRFKPTRPEAYLFISMCHERKNNFTEAQSYARIGLVFKYNNCIVSDLLGYEHYYQLEFQRVVCAYNLGQGNEAREGLQKLKDSNYPINDFYKKLIEININSLKNRQIKPMFNN